MAAAPADAISTGSAGRPLRFLLMVLLIWGCARALMSSTLLDRSAHADAEVAAARTEPGSGGTSSARLPAGTTPVAEHARLTVPIEVAPKLGHYYGRIVTVGPAAPAHHLDGVPIIPAEGSRPATASAYAAVAKGASWNSSAPIFNMIPVPTAMTSPRAAGSAPISVPPVGNETIWAEKAQSHQDRWSASAWIFWRNRVSARALGAAGQLGGAQAGARVDGRLVTLARGVPLSAYGRVSAALYRPAMPEAALGLSVRALGGPVPLSIGIERRFALDHSGGRDAFALVAVTGLYPTYVGPLIAEGYAQGGLVGFSRTDPFVDGRFSLVLPVDRKERVRLGGSVSGGAQPGLSRLDVGPVLEMRVPMGGISPRLLVEWRQRVAGHAAPGSGVSLTLASDF